MPGRDRELSLTFACFPAQVFIYRLLITFGSARRPSRIAGLLIRTFSRSRPALNTSLILAPLFFCHSLSPSSVVRCQWSVVFARRS
jgi:hypothetical protein